MFKNVYICYFGRFFVLFMFGQTIIRTGFIEILKIKHFLGRINKVTRPWWVQW